MSWQKFCNVIHVHLMFADCLAAWTAGWFLLPSLQPVSVLTGAASGSLLYSADTDGCTVHIPCTQAENSTWHFPGADWETGETEHSHTDRQVQSLTYDTVISRKLVAIKIVRR